MAERVVERVDESLKADVMHWAAFYVGDLYARCYLLTRFAFAGGADAQWEQENLSS